MTKLFVGDRVRPWEGAWKRRQATDPALVGDDPPEGMIVRIEGDGALCAAVVDIDGALVRWGLGALKLVRWSCAECGTLNPPSTSQCRNVECGELWEGTGAPSPSKAGALGPST